MRRAVVALVAALACVLAAAPGALAEPIKVINTHDSGSGSLRSAMAFANNELVTPGNDKIKINTTGAIRLQTALPAISSDMEIVGPGSSALTVTRAAGATNFRIFTIQGGETATISGLTVKKGDLAGVMEFGGGINNAGDLTLKSVVVAHNSVTGVGPASQGSGGGIYNTGSLTVLSSRITKNNASGVNGGIASGSGLLNAGGLGMERSTIDGNIGSAALYDLSGAATVENTTIANNIAIGVLVSGGATTLRSTTIAGNALPENVLVANSSAVSLENVIVAKPPQGGQNCATSGSPSFSSLGFTLSSDATCAADKHNKNPKLGKLKDNGGPTPTMALPQSSPAVDKGTSAGLNTDQRKKKRPVNFASIPNAQGGDGSDMGAFELQK